VLNLLLVLPGLLLILGLCLEAAALRARKLRHRAVIQTLASIVSQNLPLPQALRAAARGERGKLGRIYARLAATLEHGYPLSTALRLTLLSCPGEVLGAVAGAERGGTLPSVLQSLAAEARRESREPAPMGPPLWYPFLLALVAPFILAFCLVKVLPSFRAIFRDFEAQLPPATLALFAVWDWLAGLGPVLLLALLVLGWLLVHVTLGRRLLRRLPERFQLLFALWDTLTWSLPLVRHVIRNRALARQLPVLQAGVRAGHDLAEAARQAACIPVNFHAGHRLRRWAEELTAGADPRESARRLGFPGPVLEALAVAAGGADLGTRLEYVSGYYQALRYHWERVLVSVLTPSLVALWGLCVGYVVLALFLPLAALINAVIGVVY
jgi:type IV pilus assembly protein PilC